VISAAALAYELLLIRLFAIVYWHHFAQMVISLALLGYAGSGTLLTLTRNWQLRHYRRIYTGCLAAFGIGVVVCSLTAQRVPINPETLLWDGRQLVALAAVFLLLALPFLFAANAIGLTLCRFSKLTGRVYAVDLIGAGLGCGLLLVLLFRVPLSDALRWLGLAGLTAAGLAAVTLRFCRKPILLGLATCAIALLLLPDYVLRPLPSPYKALSQALQISGSEVQSTLSSPFAELTVVANQKVPWRHAPGLSLMSTAEIPEQLAVFADADSMSALTRFSGDRSELQWLAQIPSAAAYHLVSPKAVLLGGIQDNSALLQAIFHDAREIVAVEPNPQRLWLLEDEYRAFTGDLPVRPKIQLEVGMIRPWLSRTKRQFDLIVLDLGGLPPAASLASLSERYELTVEALGLYLDALRPGGFLSISFPLDLPPRIGPRLLATVHQALLDKRIADADRRLAIVRGWQGGTLLIKTEPMSPQDIAKLQHFATQRAFDLSWYPDMPRAQANRYNVLAEPWYFDAASALLGNNRDEYLRRYKFDLLPATDDRPFLLHSFRWETLAEILELRGRGGAALMDSGYLVLLAALFQALLLSGALVISPLGITRSRQSARAASAKSLRVLFYFMAIGLGYLLLEIAFIHRVSLLLPHPLYAVALVLTTFLVCSGLGSLWSSRFPVTTRPMLACLGVSLLTLVWILSGDRLWTALLSLPTVMKIVAAVATMAPLAFVMGLPFPIALTHLGCWSPTTVPWAWAVNGASSVVAALLATVLAVEFGYRFVFWTATMLYVMAAVTDPAHNARQQR